MATERTVEATVTVSKEGDQGAFADTAAEIQNLDLAAQVSGGGFNQLAADMAQTEANAENAARGLRSMNVEADHAAANLENASQSAAKGAGSLKELASSAEIGGVSLGKLTGIVGQMTAAFGLGWVAGTKLVEAMDAITDDKYSARITAMTGQFARLFDGVDEAQQLTVAANTLANQLKILKANGIDPAGLSAAELEAAVAKLGKASLDAGEAVGKFGETVGLSLGEMNKQAADLVTNTNAFAAANKQLSATDIAALIGPQIQALLDKYEQLKTAPPEALSTLAASLGVASTAQTAFNATAELSAAALNKIVEAGTTAATTVDSVATSTTSLGTTAADTKAKLEALEIATKAQSDAMFALEMKAQGVATPLQEVGDALEGQGTDAAAAGTGLTDMGTAAAGLQTSLPAATQALTGLSAIDLSNLVSQLAAARTELDAVTASAQAAKAAVTELADSEAA